MKADVTDPRTDLILSCFEQAFTERYGTLKHEFLCRTTDENIYIELEIHLETSTKYRSFSITKRKFPKFMATFMEDPEKHARLAIEQAGWKYD